MKMTKSIKRIFDKKHYRHLEKGFIVARIVTSFLCLLIFLLGFDIEREAHSLNTQLENTKPKMRIKLTI